MSEPVRRAADKILDLARAAERVRGWRAAGERVVFADGAFDGLHAGHVRALAAARRLAGRLVVGVHGDAGVAGREGPGTPVLAVSERMALVAALRSVDLAVDLEEASCEAALAALRTDVYAAGASGRHLSRGERAAARAAGTVVEIAADAADFVRSSLAVRVRARHGGGG